MLRMAVCSGVVQNCPEGTAGPSAYIHGPLLLRGKDGDGGKYSQVSSSNVWIFVVVVCVQNICRRQSAFYFYSIGSRQSSQKRVLSDNNSVILVKISSRSYCCPKERNS